MNQIREDEIIFLDFIKQVIKNNISKIPNDNFKVYLSTDDEDTKESFDLVYANKFEVSVRIRNNRYIRYSDFTIRSVSKYGGKTEKQKLIEGKGNIYFYGWKNKENTQIIKWLLVDINKIRDKLAKKSKNIRNGDGTCFCAYSIEWLNYYESILASEL
ncbi:MAG: hypothetical protein IID16_00815 [Candidatus Marinimicrobia bacterium]|nr:hypothetical protein [Candidatus Neomarinimicrobiota bacterium]